MQELKSPPSVPREGGGDAKAGSEFIYAYCIYHDGVIVSSTLPPNHPS